jgi:hypothetical protein
VLWFIISCSPVQVDADVSEEHAASIIGADLCRVKNWLSCVV